MTSEKCHFPERRRRSAAAAFLALRRARALERLADELAHVLAELVQHSLDVLALEGRGFRPRLGRWRQPLADADRPEDLLDLPQR